MENLCGFHGGIEVEGLLEMGFGLFVLPAEIEFIAEEELKAGVFGIARGGGS